MAQNRHQVPLVPLDSRCRASLPLRGRLEPRRERRKTMPVGRKVHLVTAGLLAVATSVAFSSGAAAQASTTHTSKTPAQARLTGLSTTVNDKVIVVFKDQLNNLPDVAANTGRR